MSESHPTDALKRRAVVLNGPGDVADEIISLCGDARFVLIGPGTTSSVGM